MTPSLDLRGTFGSAAFAVIGHDPAHPLRAQRDGVEAVIPGLLGLPPGAVSLRRRPGGRPLLEADGPVGCSIAHSRHWSLVAVARGCDIGVDLEAVRPDLPLDDVAATFFTADEIRWLRALPPGRGPLATTLLWAAKEAVLKAAGTGIAAGLRTPLLDGLGLSPLLDGTEALCVPLGAAARLHLRHGLLGPDHMVMAAVLVPP